MPGLDCWSDAKFVIRNGLGTFELRSVWSASARTRPLPQYFSGRMSSLCAILMLSEKEPGIPGVDHPTGADLALHRDAPALLTRVGLVVIGVAEAPAGLRHGPERVTGWFGEARAV